MGTKLRNIVSMRKPDMDYGHSRVWIFEFDQEVLHDMEGRRRYKTQCLELLGLADYVYKDAKNKPYLKGVEATVSISHSLHYLAIAVSERAYLGIDIEQSRPWEKLVRRVMTQGERLQLDRSEDREAYFFATWCAKEAVYKAYNDLSIFKDIELSSHRLGYQVPVRIRGRESQVYMVVDGYYFCLFAED